jgi:hypothetical protein
MSKNMKQRLGQLWNFIILDSLTALAMCITADPDRTCNGSPSFHEIFKLCVSADSLSRDIPIIDEDRTRDPRFV